MWMSLSLYQSIPCSFCNHHHHHHAPLFMHFSLVLSFSVCMLVWVKWVTDWLFFTSESSTFLPFIPPWEGTMQRKECLSGCLPVWLSVCSHTHIFLYLLWLRWPATSSPSLLFLYLSSSYSTPSLTSPSAFFYSSTYTHSHPPRRRFLAYFWHTFIHDPRLSYSVRNWSSFRVDVLPSFSAPITFFNCIHPTLPPTVNWQAGDILTHSFLSSSPLLRSVPSCPLFILISFYFILKLITVLSTWQIIWVCCLWSPFFFP